MATISPGGRPINETPFSTSRTSNFVARGGGLPPYVRGVARAIMRKRGVSESQAIQIAIGVMKNWAEGKGNVSPKVRAAAAKAVAQWEALKAKAHADLTAEPVTTVDLTTATTTAARVYRYRHGWIPVAKVSEAHTRLRRELTKATTTALRAKKGSREHKAALKRVDQLHAALGRLNTQL